MTGCEEPGFVALDAYIRTQLAGAAKTHASHIDVEVRLKALEARRNDDHDGAAAADS